MHFLIVGAGLTGLYIGKLLAQKGHDIDIIEKTNNLGGELRTLSYKYNGGTYYFDIGCHVPPKNHDVWNILCENVEIVNVPLPLKIKLKLKQKVDITNPLSFKGINRSNLFPFMRIGFSYLKSQIFPQKKEENLEDALVNSWGSYFYKKYLKNYMELFWKLPTDEISKHFKTRISPPRLKTALRSLFKINQQNKKKTSTYTQNIPYPYPKYGIEGVLTQIIDNLREKGINIIKNSIVESLNFEQNQFRAIIQGKGDKFEMLADKIIWTAPISDLVEKFELKKYNRLIYRNLLTINLAVSRNNILGDNVYAVYVMEPGSIFHRVHEPKKLSSFMAPENKSSICIEVILDNKNYNIQELVDMCLVQFCRLFSIPKTQIKYLGHHIMKKVYPILFINHFNNYRNFKKELDIKFNENFFLSGRLGQFAQYDIKATLNSTKSDDFIRYIDGNQD